MDTLPKDILFEIIRWLTPDDICYLAMCNKMLSQLCLDNRILFSKSSLKAYKTTRLLPIFICKKRENTVKLVPFGYLRRSHFKKKFLSHRMFMNSFIIITDKFMNYKGGYVITDKEVEFFSKTYSEYDCMLWFPKSCGQNKPLVTKVTRRSKYDLDDDECNDLLGDLLLDFTRTLEDDRDKIVNGTFGVMLFEMTHRQRKFKTNILKVLKRFTLPIVDTLNNLNIQDSCFKSEFLRLIGTGHTIIFASRYTNLKSKINSICLRVIVLDTNNRVKFVKWIKRV